MATVVAGRTYATGSTVTSTAIQVFLSEQFAKLNGGVANQGAPCKSVDFDVSAASAVALLVNIPWLHGTAYYPVPVGVSKSFVMVSDGPNHVPQGHVINVKGDGGTATFSGGTTG